MRSQLFLAGVLMLGAACAAAQGTKIGFVEENSWLRPAIFLAQKIVSANRTRRQRIARQGKVGSPFPFDLDQAAPRLALTTPRLVGIVHGEIFCVRYRTDGD